ncbi:hypothetical protein ACDI16_02110 [Oceanobacillus caeni]
MNDENLLKYFKHFNHPFYRKVDQITDEVKQMQIRKGAEKYSEPFTPSSWTGKELAIHALQELRDGQVYVVGLLERIEELEDELYDLKESAYETQMDFLEANGERNRYEQVLKEIAYHGDDLDAIEYVEMVIHKARQALEG